MWCCPYCNQEYKTNKIEYLLEHYEKEHSNIKQVNALLNKLKRKEK